MDHRQFIWVFILAVIGWNIISVESSIGESLEFRLVGGTSNTNGRVEVKVQGEWGTVCDDGFGTYEAQVLCKTMGYPYSAAMAVSANVYGPGTGRVWLDDVICTGQETNIMQCDSSPIGLTNCLGDEDVGVVCTDTQHKYRLVKGTFGQAEIFTGDRWLPISNENFNIYAAEVLCRSLHLPYSDAKIYNALLPAVGLWVENMNCFGNESSLYECPSTRRTVHHILELSSFVGVSCKGSTETSPKPVQNSNIETHVCPRTSDARGITWDERVGGTSTTEPCSSISNGLTGTVTRHCTIQGHWENPQYDCTRKELHELRQQVVTLKQNVSAPVLEKTLTFLSAVTQVADTHGGLYSGDISKAAEILDTVANVSDNVIITTEQSKSFVDVTDNLLDPLNQEAWKSLSGTKPGSAQKSAAQVLETVGKYAGAIANTLNQTNQTERVIPSKNMVLVVAKIEKPNSISFPNEATMNKLNISTSPAYFHLDKSSVEGASSYSCVIYKNLINILPSVVVNKTNSPTADDLNSAVIAIQLHSNKTNHLPSPVVMQFKHIRANYADAKCMFWNTHRQGWDNMGCRRRRSNTTSTVCECDHLTNFAILMSPWKQEIVSSKAIDTISNIGCGISIGCLIITVVLHIIFWGKLKPWFRNVILMNVCVAYALAYSIFIFGSSQTQNKTVCTVIAACLHYFLLVVFCNMLAESIDVARMVLLPLKQPAGIKWTLLAAWVVPAAVVGVSMGVSKLDGYGTESSCWLSVKNGVIWAFVGPALFVILINIVVLVLVIRIMCRTRLMQEKKIPERVRRSLWCLLMLLPLTGCTWTAGMFYVNGDSAWTQYVFVVTTTLQGFIIFLCHCILSKQMKLAIRQSVRQLVYSHASTTSHSKSQTLHIRNPFKSGRYAVSKASSTDNASENQS